MLGATSPPTNGPPVHSLAPGGTQPALLTHMEIPLLPPSAADNITGATSMQ